MIERSKENPSATTRMKSLQHFSLRHQAFEEIRASIVAGEWPVGEILSAATVAARLNVSNTPVREAMLDLENAGLIVAVRNRGYRVVDVDDNDLDEIIMVRQLLEPAATKLAASRATEADIHALSLMVDEIEQTAVESDVNGFLIADRRFHIAIVELTGNGRLARIVGQLRDQTRLVGLLSLARSGELDASANEHRPILDAVANNNGSLAERLMRQHLRHARGQWAGRTEQEFSNC